MKLEEILECMLFEENDEKFNVHLMSYMTYRTDITAGCVCTSFSEMQNLINSNTTIRYIKDISFNYKSKRKHYVLDNSFNINSIKKMILNLEKKHPHLFI